ncbi:hypothetical protein PLESTM_000328000 [Pleodorina starrii]|nr:hypothetical protein PLESTM_000328000 [Pleodorina starrii]
MANRAIEREYDDALDNDDENIVNAERDESCDSGYDSDERADLAQRQGDSRRDNTRAAYDKQLRKFKAYLSKKKVTIDKTLVGSRLAKHAGRFINHLTVTDKKIDKKSPTPASAGPSWRRRRASSPRLAPSPTPAAAGPS